MTAVAFRDVSFSRNGSRVLDEVSFSVEPGHVVALVGRSGAGKSTLLKLVNRLLLSSLLGFDARGYRDRLDQAPACLNVLDFRDAVRARLMLFNDTSHYANRPRFATDSLSKWWDER